jgi:hypothetical protein
MAKLVVGPFNKGLKTDRLPFAIDNDSFPQLINAYQWRGRIKRKRGTSLLGRLNRFFNSNSVSYSSTTSFNLVAGAGNLLTGFGLQANGSIIPGTILIVVGANTYSDPAMDGTLVGAPAGTGTINYATGDITITGGGASAVSGQFVYYPQLPVMGLEELDLDTSTYPGTLGFDTTYVYNIEPEDPQNIYDVSFYKNLATATPGYPGYIQKTTPTPTSWNGQDYQQFWSTNYEGAFWVTNGINVPFSTTNIGMQFAPASTITFIGRTATTITVNITNCPLIRGDFVFLNEWTGPTDADSQTLNFQSGYVTAIAGVPPLLTVTITLPDANIAAVVFIPGIIQYLTNRSDVTKDCIRWYDGNPTNGSPTAPVFITGKGWVNFMPPLSRFSYSIAQLPPAQYYLVGCRMIVPFKDRLLFIGAVVQTSIGVPIYLSDTVVYSQNGTPYYTASFTGDPSLSTTIFTEILVPTNKTASPAAYWSDQTGFGGFVSAGISQEILTVASNEDVLIMGFPQTQTRFVYTGNDILPFNFFLIDSELSSASTFSVINMGSSVLTRGDRGFIQTTQRQAQRIDYEILENTFQVGLRQNGAERFTAQRDYDNEWVYFTYRSNQNSYKFPTQTLQYNYREGSWAIFNETYTHYGQFRKASGFTWATVGKKYPTWSSWNAPWNASTSTLLNPDVIAGNQQGFIVIRDEGTNESDSLTIQSISLNTVTCPNHCLNNGDYIVISGCIGGIASQVNGKIFSVAPPITTDTFTLNGESDITADTYFGGGLIKRMYRPIIQTRQFPVGWDIGRKTRIGVQQYLLTATPKGQIQLLIYLSQDSATPYNAGGIVPYQDVFNSSLIYSTVLYTCIESTNLGLTPANMNLLMIGTPEGTTGQSQIWHRVSTSLIGDTVQLGFTMSDAQMRDINFNNQFTEIELHGFNLEVYPSQILA